MPPGLRRLRSSPAVWRPNLKPLRILLAEDNEFNAQHLERLLVRGHHSVRLANNGREALALLGIDDPDFRGRFFDNSWSVSSELTG